MTSTYAVLYLRQSRDFTGEGLAIERQEGEAQGLIERRNWSVREVLRDNDVSAAGKKKRPGFERLLELIEGGEVTVVVAWDLTRLTRNARDTLRLLEAGEAAGLTLALVRGSDIDLSTPAGRLTASVLAAVARHEIEQKADRQRAAAAQRADQGRPPLGVRLTGYTVAGELIEDEAATVRTLFQRFAAGDSLKGLAAWLTETGVPTRHGGRWIASTVQGILRNPRYAGRAIYQGETTGKPGVWSALVAPEVFDQVAARLADPRRITNREGTDRKHLGAGLFRCAVCDRPCSSFSGHRYRCKEAHVNRSRPQVDEFVIKLVRARLARPDLGDLLPKVDNEEVARLNGEIQRLEGRLRQTEEDYDAELIDGRRYKVKTEKINAELAASRSARARLTAPGAAAEVLAADDPVAAFDGAPLMIRRAVIEALCVVRLAQGTRGSRIFDPWTLGTSQWTDDPMTWSEHWEAEGLAA
ncbi:recombinase family protein [Actinoplanes sp. NPDC026619]|uniref:recombinase family protein n=1 Tax=Actinoplanes sp. NPDC026619 TaxID=3155798 RepID=UPI0033DFE521